jgi:hypothetical protein
LTTWLATSSTIAPLLRNAEDLRLQVLISVPSGDRLVRGEYRVDEEYFYPASTIKLPLALAALEKLGALRRAQHDAHDRALDVESPLRITRAGVRLERDLTNFPSGRISLAHEIRKALIVSDNEAFNRLFDFVGWDEAHERLWQEGFKSLRVRHYVGSAGQDPKVSSPMSFLVGTHEVKVPPRTFALELPATAAPGLLLGQTHFDASGRLVPGPMSFEQKNAISLRDLHDMLIAITAPSRMPSRSLAIDEKDRAFLVRTLGTLPSQSYLPAYQARAQGLDELHRPMLLAVRKALPGHDIRSYGKGGQAYGFVIHNTYLVDETTKRGVYVTAAIHVNENGRLNDDQYEYNEIAKPFIEALGALVAKRHLEAEPSAP